MRLRWITSRSRSTPAAPAPAPAAPIPSGDPAEKDRLLAELAAQKDANSRLSEQLARLSRPQVNVPIFSLGFLRGDDGTANRVVLGREPRWIVLSVELPPETAKSYRATLTAAGGGTVWAGEGLIPNADGTVTVSLYSGKLEPGPHRLRLTGVDAQGGRLRRGRSRSRWCGRSICKGVGWRLFRRSHDRSS